MQQITEDHDEIREWVEKLGGKPALIDHPDGKSDPVGIRIDFPGELDEVLLSESYPEEPISWSQFFRIFEEKGLMFAYEEEPTGDDPTLWYRFEKRGG